MADHKPPSTGHNTTGPAALLLRGAAGLVTVGGLGLVIWLIDKHLRYGFIRARQFGRFGPEVPLWIPLTLFVCLCTAGLALLFWRAARRVQAGEDLYARRHRRPPRDRRDRPEP